jgi:hypothetical protein
MGDFVFSSAFLMGSDVATMLMPSDEMHLNGVVFYAYDQRIT